VNDVLSTVLYATGGVFEIPVIRRIEQRRSAYQEIVVADTEGYGRCLVIDGVMQTASTDHLIYDDAILAPLRPTDRDVLIVGGGDGYVARRARELAPGVRLTVVDIDDDVVDVADRWLNPGFRADPDTTIHIGDGVAFARRHPRASFDGVVLDLTDIPVDPARSEDVKRLYVEMLDAVLPLLRAGGWLSMQGGPSAVPAGDVDVAAIVAELAGARLRGLVRSDVVLPSYGEGNAFFHGVP
jgi:spermidine synthase